MTILVAGSRGYTDYEEFRDIMNYICKKYDNIELVSGGAFGADKLAERYAQEKGFSIKIFRAEWTVYGRQAGFKRNHDMHTYLHQYPERLCVCFWDGESHGTKHNFQLCETGNTPLICYNYKLHRKVEV